MSARPVQSALATRMHRVAPGGVNSNVRLEVADRFFVRARGARLWDADGADFVDYVLGQGPAFLGHAHPRILAAVTAAIADGVTYAAQSPIELEAAEKLVAALGWAQKVRIGMTSTESVQAALRLARAATGRTRFLRFRGQYHGWLDNVLLDSTTQPPSPASDGQLASELAQGVTVEWNDVAALVAALDEHGDDLAAVISEPMMLNAGAILPAPGYLEALRAECTARGIVLILDETITGFRLSATGAVGRFGVVPDLAVYGKAVAGGMPASVLAGSAALMDRFAAGTNHSGTFNANVLSCAAIAAAMDVLREPGLYERVERVGGQLMTQLRELASARGLDLTVSGLPVAFHCALGAQGPIGSYADLQQADAGRYRALVAKARQNGVWLANRGIWYVSVAHDDTTTADTLDRMADAIDALEGAP